MLSDRLLLITKDLYVFELSPDALNDADSDSTIYIGSMPQSLQDKWPSLYNDPSFQELYTGQLIYNSFTVMSSDGDYLFFTTKQMITSKAGVTFDMKKNIVLKGLTYKDADDQVLISASERLSFFALNKEGDQLNMAQYRFMDPFSKAVSHVTEYINRVTPWRRMCVSDSEDNIYLSESNCTTPLTWPVLKGFVNGNKFYIFGPQNIYIFSVELVKSPGTRVTVTKKPYDGFFICSVDYAKWLLIALAILLLLLALLYLLWVYCCKKDQKTKLSGGYRPAQKNDRTRSTSVDGPTRSTTPFSARHGEDMTKRSKFDKKSKKEKRAKKIESPITNSRINSVTARSVFKPKG